MSETFFNYCKMCLREQKIMQDMHRSESKMVAKACNLYWERKMYKSLVSVSCGNVYALVYFAIGKKYI